MTCGDWQPGWGVYQSLVLKTLEKTRFVERDLEKEQVDKLEVASPF